MPCFKPLKGYRGRIPGKNGKFPVVFNVADGYADKPLSLPCGQCIGCRLEKSRQWAIRCVHEASLYEDNCFITLTYDDEHLPEDKSLNKKHFQDFMKRLRFRSGKRKIRYFHCGEYGEQYGRPHYHACLFNYDFVDKRLWKKSNDVDIFTSETLDEIWGKGFTTIGSVTFESAAYVARYVMKKITGNLAESHYTKIDETTGEVTKKQPEYTTMSRRPGLGLPWLTKFRKDVYPSDEIIINGKKMKPPKYYDKMHEILYPSDYDDTRYSRIRRAKEHADNNTPARLAVRETVQEARLKLLPRDIE